MGKDAERERERERIEHSNKYIGNDATSTGYVPHPSKPGWWRPFDGDGSFIHYKDAPPAWPVFNKWIEIEKNIGKSKSKKE